MNAKNNDKNMHSLDGAVIYQINLRAFTPEGTIKSAEKLIPHLSEIGIDIVYLCPVNTADDDSDINGFSERQLKSGFNNPKNPYRIKDYYSIDEEYGTTDDLVSFSETIHKYKMKLILDAVFYHCGPGAVFVKDHPDYIMRKPDGKPDTGSWHFPKLNFENPELREYLIGALEYFMIECGADGYRCDVGDGVPLDFWNEARTALEQIDPSVIMINEGTKAEAVECAFDANYDFGWSDAIQKVAKGEKAASEIVSYFEAEQDRLPEGANVLRAYENHDYANDAYYDRLEKKLGSRAIEALNVLNFTISGVPFVYNGSEIADFNRHSIFGNRFTTGCCVIDWSNALTENGRRRKEVITRLCSMRHEIPALMSGITAFIENDRPTEVLSFVREAYERDSCEDNCLSDECGHEHGVCAGCGDITDIAAVVINLSDKPLTVNIKSDAGFDSVVARSGVYFEYKEENLRLDILPWGYIVGKM